MSGRAAGSVLLPHGRLPRSVGLTLVEVLVALLVLAIAILAGVRLAGALVRSERQSAARRELASFVRNELRFQRNVRAHGCVGDSPGPGWSCRVERTCLDGTQPCETEAIRVTVAPPSGRPLVARTAVWWPLQRAEVVGAAP